jgi:ketosteroid isomerase-like protein
MFPILAGVVDKKAFRDWVFKKPPVADVSVKLEVVTASEDRLALEASSNMEVNGNSYCNTYHWPFESWAGKICAARFYLDTLFAKKAMESVDEAEVAQGRRWDQQSMLFQLPLICSPA